MRYSFIHPKPKRRLDRESRLLGVFFVITLLMVVGFSLFLWIKKGMLVDEIGQMDGEIRHFKEERADYNRQIERILALSGKYEAIQTGNTLLKESIRNLFDLVPDQITLTKAMLNRDGLVLYGVTPTKEVYNYLLLAPLKSVFQRNTTTFYPLKNGWWRFVSVNEGSMESGEEE
ncbi:MAG: hypothetical protein GXO33_08935 [Epsilonproteobacteria bacterium]|nr:hypothetical protein [Campylobacterota bacterium]